MCAIATSRGSRTSPRPRRARRTRVAPAFSLIELVIVLVIIGIISAIAVPRIAGAAERASARRLQADLRTLSVAVQHYAAEHNGSSPAHNADGTITTPAVFARRLIKHTDELGNVSASGIFGPYLRELPTNPRNNRAGVRIDGPPAGANIAGWRFDSTTWAILADDSPAAASVTAETRLRDIVDKLRSVGPINPGPIHVDDGG